MFDLEDFVEIDRNHFGFDQVLELNSVDVLADHRDKISVNILDKDR